MLPDGVYAPLLALALPLLLWPLEMLIRLPVIWEELAKLVLAIYLSRLKRVTTLEVFVVGVLFGISEAALYVLNINFLGNMWPMLWRLMTTVPLHGLTIVVMYEMGRRYGRRGFGVGWLASVAIHFGFNWVV